MTTKKASFKDQLNSIVDEIELQIKKKYDICFQKISSEDGEGVGFYLSLAGGNREKTAAQIGQAIDTLKGRRNLLGRFATSDQGEKDRYCEGGYAEKGYNHFKNDLAAIHKKSVRTRLPFTVTLIQPDYQGEKIAQGKENYDRLISFIKVNLDPGDLFYTYSKDLAGKGANGQQQIMALIMPATGIKRARQVIETIKNNISPKNESLNFSQSLSIGLQVSNSGDFKSVDALLNTVEENLQIASRSGDCIHWQYKKNKEKSCQVTAEERAQLFSFLR